MHVEMVAAFAAMIFSKPTFIAGGSGMEEVRCVNNVSALYSSYCVLCVCIPGVYGSVIIEILVHFY